LDLVPAFAGQAVFCFWVLFAVTLLAGKSLTRVAAIALAATDLTLAPATLRTARNWPRTAEYKILVDGSRKLASRPQAVRAIRIGFPVPSANSAEFLYTILGGRIDPASPWMGVITTNGDVTYQSLSRAQ
jgi:hypothetical protein